MFAPHGLDNQKVFISLSPERLCHVYHKQLKTEALAGTYNSSTFQPSTFQPSSQVNYSEKDSKPLTSPDSSAQQYDNKTQDEHAAVTNYIYNKLNTLGNVIVEDRQLLRLKDVVHFRQFLSVTTDTNTSDATTAVPTLTPTTHPITTTPPPTATTAIPTSESGHNSDLSGPQLLAWGVTNLHPTPAVCGYPVETAKSYITQYEKFNRELYASYCGILDHTGGDLLVGLRSAMIYNNKVHIYAGAGLIMGSIAESEYTEITLKMSQYTRILYSLQRPVLQHEFLNATYAQCAILIEEMLRQGIGAFIICPGSRSTPLVVAIYRHSIARSITQVIHDERCAGFYALGCAKAGILCAVVVTSGTAVSNLLPSISEARESNLPIVLLTADRPSESRDVGEAQTIKQTNIYNNIIGYERDFPPLSSDDLHLSTYLMNSMLADIAYGIGYICMIRKQVIQYNFQFRKPDLEPYIKSNTYSIEYYNNLSPKIKKWLYNTTLPYTIHTNNISNSSNSSICYKIIEYIQQYISYTSYYNSILVIAGEITLPREVRELRRFCEMYNIPCICDTLSMLTDTTPTPTYTTHTSSANTTNTNAHNSNNDNDCIFLSTDRLCNSPLLLHTLSTTVRMIIRVGGSVISAKVSDWVGRMSNIATTVRIRDDGYSQCRHDPMWLADYYIHDSLYNVLTYISSQVVRFMPKTGVYPCHALRVLRLAQSVHRDGLDTAFSPPTTNATTTINTDTTPSATVTATNTNTTTAAATSNTDIRNNCSSTSDGSVFSEPLVCRTIFNTLPPTTPFFVSSSMACRDFDAYSGLQASEDRHSTVLEVQGVLASENRPSSVLERPSFRRVGCNRGANGIDGVISTAVGYANACTTSSSDPLVLLIGDIATLYDLSAVSFAAGTSPGYCHTTSIVNNGGGRVGKIIVLNNSGGGIFSFLPAVKYKAETDFFTPYMDTPHNLNISDICRPMMREGQKAVRVGSVDELKRFVCI